MQTTTHSSSSRRRASDPVHQDAAQNSLYEPSSEPDPISRRPRMSSHAHTGGSTVHAPMAEHSGFIRKYIFSVDHKVIGIQYFLLALTAVCIGIVLSLLMRFHLVYPGAHLPFVSGGIMTPEQYLALVTMHGTIMVFFVLTTAPQGGFGNYFLPIQIGAPDMAFPRLNMLSFWTTFIA